MKHAWIVALLLFSAVAPLSAQQGPRYDTRGDLEARRDSLTLVIGSLADNDERLSQLERRVATVEQRLRIGDHRPGDVVGLVVRGQEEMTGNFPVQPDQTIKLPGVPPIPLAGVLFSEAEEVIRGALATVLQNPRVELATQIRLAVTGQVGNPGFYDVSGTLLLSDVIQLAGGPTQTADLDGLQVRRQGETVMKGEDLVTRGVTLDELGLRSGDVVDIPQETSTFNTVRTIGILLGAIASAIALISLL